MLQLTPPLPRVVVGGPGWNGPTGAGVANLILEGHRDEDLVWVIDLDTGGQTWCVPNRFVRAPKNTTYGRVHAVQVRGTTKVHAPEPSEDRSGV